MACPRRDVAPCAVTTSYQSPWQNGVAYCNQDRTHLGVGKDSPLGRPAEPHRALLAITPTDRWRATHG